MTDYQGTDDYTDYYFQSLDNPPSVSEMYDDISEEFKIQNLDTSYFDQQITVKGVQTTRCPLLKSVYSLLCDNFNLYYATREIGGYSEYDFFCMMQSCLNRNADTFERQLNVYWDDIANPILGRTEKVTYNTKDKRDNTGTTELEHGLETERLQKGEEITHHVEVPADSPSNDVDRSRDKLTFSDPTSNPRITKDSNSGTDTNTVNLHDVRQMTGDVITELSDLGVRPNYESLNGFLDNNRTFIQEFINKFEECFAPRYRRVYF